jgi:hypothetical protein
MWRAYSTRIKEQCLERRTYHENAPQKETSENCEKTFTPVPGKVFNKILLENMEDVVDVQVQDNQEGLRQGRSCTDQITTQALHHCWAIPWVESLNLCQLCDFLKAIPLTVSTGTPWNLLWQFRISAKLCDEANNRWTKEWYSMDHLETVGRP